MTATLFHNTTLPKTMRSLPLLVVAGCMSVACTSSNTKLVDRVTAYDNYYTASYEHKCPPNPQTEPCKTCKATINDAEWKVRTANLNAQLGTIPPKEKVELEAVVADLEAHCP